MASKIEIVRGISSVTSIEVAEGTDFPEAIKRPIFPMTPLAEKGFNYLTDAIVEDPFLAEHIPPTQLIRDTEQTYFTQGLVQTRPGKENMADLRDPFIFDDEQLVTPEQLQEITRFFMASWQMYKESTHHGDSGLEEGVGWFLEAHRPDSYVLGRLPEDDKDKVYFVDCHPILPLREEEAVLGSGHFVDYLGLIARERFDASLEELVPGSNALPLGRH